MALTNLCGSKTFPLALGTMFCISFLIVVLYCLTATSSTIIMDTLTSQYVYNASVDDVIPLSFKDLRFYDNSIPMGVPALMVAGPPKTGTWTLSL